jgi:hypothetical protein
MQLVQAFMCLGTPPTKARTRWTFGLKRRLVLRCEWLTAIANPGRFPQISHTDATKDKE